MYGSARHDAPFPHCRCAHARGLRHCLCAVRLSLCRARRLGICGAHAQRGVLQRRARGLSRGLSPGGIRAAAARRRAAPCAGLCPRGRAGSLPGTGTRLLCAANLLCAAAGLRRGARPLHAASPLCRSGAATAGAGAVWPTRGDGRSESNRALAPAAAALTGSGHQRPAPRRRPSCCPAGGALPIGRFAPPRRTTASRHANARQPTRSARSDSPFAHSRSHSSFQGSR